MANKVIIQEALRGSGNADDLESTGDLVVSGSGKGMLVSAAKSIAAAGTVQTDATALTAQLTVVNSTASGAGVRIQSRVADGMRVTVINKGSAALAVWPPVGHYMGSSAVNNAFSIGAGQAADFVGASQGLWFPTRFAL